MVKQRPVISIIIVVTAALISSLLAAVPHAASDGRRPTTTSAAAALLIIDVQNCFTSGGTLAVPGADDVIPVVNRLRRDNRFDWIVLTQDWHCPDHVSFASQHPGCRANDVITLTYVENTGEMCHQDGACVTPATTAIPAAVNCSTSRQVRVDQHLWPDHCVINTTDAQFHGQLIIESTDIVVQKGYHCQIDSYSGFYDNGHVTSTELNTVLSERNVTTVFIVGIATDYCVYYTAKDANSLGYETYVVQDATRGLAESTINAAISDMRNSGIKVISTPEVPSALSIIGSSACRISMTSSTAAAILAVACIAIISSYIV